MTYGHCHHRYPRPVIFKPVLPSIETIQLPMDRSDVPTTRAIEAYAHQTCVHCGYRRIIDYSGKTVKEGYDIDAEIP